LILEIVLIIALLIWTFAVANVLAFIIASIHLFKTEKDLTRKVIWFSILLSTGLMGALGYFLTRIWNARIRKRDPDGGKTFEDHVMDRLRRKDARKG
jgi:uncharacterized membrane protein